MGGAVRRKLVFRRFTNLPSALASAGGGGSSALPREMSKNPQTPRWSTGTVTGYRENLRMCLALDVIECAACFANTALQYMARLLQRTAT
jgi:hypothetical protein